ncbi:MAG: hypothetical protein DME87_03830 [Verrucomicrobia bacterium]|nr:MAG: hypothetical protein DME87_03830 [Verrucomicrobiota bacterium]
MKSLLVRQVLILAALGLVPGIGQAIYFRDKVSWRSPVPASEMVTVTQARAWGENAIWVDARPDNEFARDHVPGALPLNEDRWVARRLRNEAQLPNVFVLEGGWEEWLKTRK